MTPKLTTLVPLFLDLDGVFADFNRRVEVITGKLPNQLSTRELWAAINRDQRFFLELDLMPGSWELWLAARPFNPQFLTGAPSIPAFRDQKREWVSKTFGPSWTTHVVSKKDKPLYVTPGAVLIDDTRANIDAWVAAGGVGIHHTDPQLSISELLNIVAGRAAA